MPTVVPFHQAVLTDPAFIATDKDGFKVHTRWIETEFTGEIKPYAGVLGEAEEAEPTQTVVVEVNGKRMEVKLPQSLGVAKKAPAMKKPVKRNRSMGAVQAPTGNSMTSPMQGTVVKVAVSEGDTVAEGDLIVVIEAMKMEQPLNAHRAGVIKNLTVEPGAPLASGAVICEIADPE